MEQKTSKQKFNRILGVTGTAAVLILLCGAALAGKNDHQIPVKTGSGSDTQILESEPQVPDYLDPKKIPVQ